MGPKDAVKAVEFLQPPPAILMHYDTFDVIARVRKAWQMPLLAQTPAEPGSSSLANL